MILKLGTIVTAASGAIGGVVIANKQGNPTAQNRGRRRNQQTSAQQQTKCTYNKAMDAFRKLPAITQYAWKLYAIKNTRQNRLGVQRKLSATQLYLQQAGPRIAAGLGTPGSPPAKGQQGIGYPSGIAFTAGGPYTFSATTPTNDPVGYYLLQGARTTSTSRIGKLSWRALPAIAASYSVTADLHAAWVAVMGECGQHEIVLLRIRYAGNYSIISAASQLQLTVG